MSLRDNGTDHVGGADPVRGSMHRWASREAASPGEAACAPGVGALHMSLYRSRVPR